MGRILRTKVHLSLFIMATECPVISVTPEKMIEWRKDMSVFYILSKECLEENRECCCPNNWAEINRRRFPHDDSSDEEDSDDDIYSEILTTIVDSCWDNSDDIVASLFIYACESKDTKLANWTSGSFDVSNVEKCLKMTKDRKMKYRIFSAIGVENIDDWTHEEYTMLLKLMEDE